jgi:hypothetical protein
MLVFVMIGGTKVISLADQFGKVLKQSRRKMSSERRASP